MYLIQENGGAMRDRTADLLRARQALSQLSYNPFTYSENKYQGTNYRIGEAKSNFSKLIQYDV
jgi:hypothetical protein